MNARMLTTIRWLCSLVLVLFLGCQTDQAKKSDGLQQNNATREQNPSPDEVAEGDSPEILPQTHLTAGKLHESQGHLARAIEQYEQVIALAPDNLEAYNRMGIVLDRLGRFKEADAAFNKAIKRALREAFLRNNLAFSYIMQTRWKEAESELTQALEDRPDFARARVNLGMVYAQQEQFDKAFAQFELGLPKEDAYYNLGLMYQSKRRPADAAVAFKNALKVNPKLVAAQKRLDALPPDVSKAVKEESAVTASPVANAPVVIPASDNRTSPASQPAQVAVTTRPSKAADASAALATTQPSQANAVKPKPATTRPSQAVAAKPANLANVVNAKRATTQPSQAAAVKPAKETKKTATTRPSQAAAVKPTKPARTVDINVPPTGPVPAKAAANQPQALPATSRPSQAAAANHAVQPTQVLAATAPKPVYRPLDDQWWTNDSFGMPVDSAKQSDITCDEEQDEYDARNHIVKVWRSLTRPLNGLKSPTKPAASPYPPFGPPTPKTGVRPTNPSVSKSPNR